MDIKEIGILGPDINRHWYYNSKAEALMRMLRGLEPTTILDIGAGSGFFSHHLLANTIAREAWCVDIGYATDTDEEKTGKTIHYRRSIDRVDADLVILMDVLEHVDDDIGLLTFYLNKVPPGSRFLISVPAFDFLWSGHDEFLGHKRRYTLKQLESTVSKSGLKIAHGAYYFSTILPIAAALRLWQTTINKNVPVRSQLSRHHPIVNWALKSLCSIELPIMRFNRLAGLTALCLAELPENQK